MKYDDAYEYVKDYFQRNFLESYLIFEGRMQYIENIYVNFYKDNIRSQYSVDDIISGRIDGDINKYLENFVGEYFTRQQREDILVLNDYVNDLLVERGVNINYSNDIFEHIVRLVSSRVWSQFDRSRIGKEDFKHIINLVYNNICNQYARLIDKKIEKILDNRLDYFELRKLGLDKEELKKYVIDSVFKNEIRSFLIKLKILVVNPDRELSDTGIKLNKYINQFFSKYSVKDKVDKNVDYVRSSSFYNQDEDVEEEKKVQNDNGEIKFNLNNMKSNSVKNGLFPDKIRLSKKQIMVSKAVITLALLGTLLGVGLNVSNQEKYTDDDYAMMRVEMLSGFDYDKKVGRDNKFNNDMMNEVISLYSKLEQLPSESYKNLGLYNVYNGFYNIMNNNNDKTLIEMENFFGSLRKKIVSEELMIGINDSLKVYEENYFFLDFVYDTLINMGYNEFNNDKYQDALLRYKYANFGNQYGVVGVYLTKDELKLIDDVLNKYVECYEKIKLDIGYLMINGDYTFFDTYSDKSKRGI